MLTPAQLSAYKAWRKAGVRAWTAYIQAGVDSVPWGAYERLYDIARQDARLDQVQGIMRQRRTPWKTADRTYRMAKRIKYR